MRPIAFAVPVALLSLVTACGTSSQPVDRTTAAASPTTSESSSTPSESSSSPGESSSGGADDKALTGEVGKTAFEISLKDDKGAAVTSLKAGTYKVKIKDPSTIHNFHLTGTGVDETTGVKELEEVTWTVTFKAGTYTYVCDPHPTMKGSLTVT